MIPPEFPYLKKFIKSGPNPSTSSNQNQAQTLSPAFSSTIIFGFFSNTSSFIGQLLVVLFLLYFLLVAEDLYTRKLIEVLPHLAEKKNAVVIMRSIKEQISIYLLTKSILNVGLAVALCIALFFLKMPNPIIWGIIGGILEFIPYIGVLIGSIAIAIGSILTFNDSLHMILVPLSFFLISSFEGNVLTPYFLGHNLSIHPVYYFHSHHCLGMDMGSSWRFFCCTFNFRL